MKSFREKMILWYGSVFLGLMLFMLLVSILASIYHLADAQRGFMKKIAKGITRELVAGRITAPEAAQNVGQRVDDQLSLFGEHGAREVAYAIYTDQGNLLYRSPEFDIAIDERYDTDEDGKLFLKAVRSEATLLDKFSLWDFVYRYQRDGYVVFVRSEGRFELAERFVERLVIAVLVAMLLDVPSGYFFGKKIVAPLTSIAAALKKIRAGRLSTRIPPLHSDDEFELMIDALNETFAELESSFQRIEQFSANAAHELRTPLTALRGSLEVCLRRTRTPEEYQQVLREAIHEIVSLSQLVADLLLISRAGASHALPQSTAFDFSHWVEEIFLKGEFSDSAQLFQREIAPNLFVRGDALLLKRVCLNLIQNAVKFSPTGKPIRIGLHQQDAEVIFSVSDQGIGIAPEEQKSVFERFYQCDPSRASGSGLGLAIVKWIIDCHQGRIELDSQPGVGTTVRVSLPAAAP